ncbi:hypothetical protein PoB_005424300 [Plakobranchus ocellatus]|uniref:Reverse transcriptase domain-containing protein n=1 Tax=Plakobranchus ocellatus TaxID=259542 RepID=A0AAV4C894_9GAST|nr:hypothetical protein PoB_005424300 [Plakobranchus ocellatus]
MLKQIEDFGIGKVTHLLNEIYDTGHIPADLSRSIFIALPKKPGATECELHRTISLMSHITKILLKIIMLRIRNNKGGQNISNLRYADDTVLIAENKEDLQKLLNIVEEESRKKGLELNSKKTEVMVISRKQESPKCVYSSMK